MGQKMYPWFRVKNLYNGKLEFNINPCDEFPAGWWKAFGPMMLEELDTAIREEKLLEEFYICQIKEKYGQLRFYYHPYSEKIDRIVQKYEELSQNICINCGKPDVPMINFSWISPYCKNCYDEIIHKKKERLEKLNMDFDIPTYQELSGKKSQMPNSYTITRYSYDKQGKIIGKTDIKYNIAETADRIRKMYNNREF